MALQKQSLEVPFSLGLDTKTDPWQVDPGKFLALSNSVFTTGKLLRKRNGLFPFTSLPVGALATTLTTFKANLTAIGQSLFAYSNPSQEWEDRGRINTLALSVQELVRTPYSNSAPDVAISPNGLALSVFLDGDGSYKYNITDSTTSQTLVTITNLPATATKARVFVLGNHFVITFLATAGGGPHLEYIAVPLNNIDNPSAATDISTQVSGLSAGYDGYVVNSALYIAWDGSDGGGAIRVTYIDSTLTQHATVVETGHSASLMSVTADTTGSTPVIYVTAFKTADAYTYAFTPSLLLLSGFPAHSITSTTVVAITSSAQSMTLSLFYEVSNSYPSSVRSDYVETVTVSQAGVVGSPSVVIRSVGLASKSFDIDFTTYMMVVYAGSFQPTYFLIDYLGNVVAKVAYSNGSGYVTTEVLPSATVNNSIVSIGYLLQDLIIPVNKSMDAPSVAGVYSQTGVNVVTFNFSKVNLVTAEIGNSLNISGGFMWMYDGVRPVEQGFAVWPEDIALATATTGGFLADQQYFYQVTYEWTDGQGNIHRSAPSIPQTITTSGGGTSTVTLVIPTLRLTYKTAPNGVRIVIYRWSTAQQTFYQVTSVTSPLLNDPTVDTVTYVDTLVDSDIIGNNIIYTTGGVVEDIAPPATDIITLFKSRLVLVDAEDPNLIWYSKQLIEAVPVEMSDLFTIFVSPTSGAQGSTGPITALAPLDDKLIVFKKDAIYYITGDGPDNTGANDDFSDPVFITAVVGCTNQQSIVFTPQGLLFQSDNGIWMLGRDLSTTYIGAPVEAFNSQLVVSSTNIPGENQVRFTLQPGTSSTLFQGMHTVLNSVGSVLQETPNEYLDGQAGEMLMYDYFYQQWGTFDVRNAPVTIGFTTSWINLAGVQGYERLYYFYILGRFLSPHKLQVSIAYNYNDSDEQSFLITPPNYSGPYGSDPQYGASGPYGGIGDLEQWRVFPRLQRCQSFRISVQEVFNNAYSTVPGAGLTISGLNLILGIKKAYRPMPASRSVG